MTTCKQILQEEMLRGRESLLSETSTSKTVEVCSASFRVLGVAGLGNIPAQTCYIYSHLLLEDSFESQTVSRCLVFSSFCTTVLSLLDFSILENFGCLPQGKPTTTESHYPTYSAWWMV